MDPRIHDRASRKWLVALVLLAVSSGLPAKVMTQEPAHVSSADSGIVVSLAAPEEYWTPERMAAAQPYPEQAVFASATTVATADALPVGDPGAVSGVPPQASEEAALAAMESVTKMAGPAAGESVEPQHAGYPPPHTTWQWFGRYRTYPMSTIGKVFFNQDHDANGTVSSFVCSGSTIGNKYVLTAGHCVNNGRNGAGANGGWSTAFTFCPSYDSSQGGVNPAVGCWTAYNLATSGSWFSSSNFDRDWGGAAMNLCSSRNPPGCTTVGTAVGWLGRAWNWNDEHWHAFGYPAAAPYTGGKIIANGAEHSYTINQGTGADSKYQGNEMTGGSSGGPWIFRFGTGNWADGVNSHKRCTAAGCPPGSILTQEMGSPPFTSEAGGSEDFFAFLFTL